MNQYRSLLALAATLFVLTACQGPGSGPRSEASLEIRFGASARTMVPTQSLDVATIDVSGTGPGVNTFTLNGLAANSPSTGRIYLAVGAWTVNAVAKNNLGTPIASGAVPVTVVSGADTTASLNLTPLAGNGVVSLTATWPAGIVQNPVVTAVLTPLAGGSDVPLAVSSGTGGLTVNLDGPAVASGSYTLTVILKDGATEVGRGVEGVKVAQGMNTTGTMHFLYDPSVGTLAVDLSVQTSQPIEVNLAAGLGVLELGAATSVSALTPTTAIDEYRWYVNGVRLAGEASATLNFGASRTVGTYRIDAVVFRSDRVGSASTVVQVIRPRAAGVVFSPAAGAVDSGTVITMSTATSGAQIRYTTDGTAPTPASALYDAANRPVLNVSTIYRAIAVAANSSDSLPATAAYTALGPTDVVYVSTTGADTNAGTAAAPKQTVEAAVALAQANSVPEVRIAAGTYQIVAKYGVALTKTLAIRGGYNPTNWADRAFLTEADRTNAAYKTVLAYYYPFNGTSADDATRIFDISDTNAGDGVAVAPVFEGLTFQPKTGGSWATALYVHDLAFPSLQHVTVTGSITAGNAQLVRVKNASLSVSDSAFSGSSTVADWDLVFDNSDASSHQVQVVRNSFRRAVANSGGTVSVGNDSTDQVLTIEDNVFRPVSSGTSLYYFQTISVSGHGSISRNQITSPSTGGMVAGIFLNNAQGKDTIVAGNVINLAEANYDSWGGNGPIGLLYGLQKTVVSQNSISVSAYSQGLIRTLTPALAVVDNLMAARYADTNTSYGIYGPAALIANNTIVLRSTQSAYFEGIRGFDANTRIVNNVIALDSPDKNDGGINDFGGNPLELRNNLFYFSPGATGWYYFDNQDGYAGVNDLAFVNNWDITTRSSTKASAGNLAVSPAAATLFSDAANNNYHLDVTALNSVGTKGADLSGESSMPTNSGGQPVDLDGAVRTLPWSIGAYERD